MTRHFHCLEEVAMWPRQGWWAVYVTWYIGKTQLFFPKISDNKWPVDGIKVRNLRQETHLLQKIAHHNYAHHPCPSQHQRSLFGKCTLAKQILIQKGVEHGTSYTTSISIMIFPYFSISHNTAKSDTQWNHTKITNYVRYLLMNHDYPSSANKAYDV